MKEFITYIVDKLNTLFPGMDITERDIDDAHIYQTKNFNRLSNSQLVIIRFVSRLVRNRFFANKRLLKDKSVAITEHLTAQNLRLLKAAQAKVGVKKAWTHYGKVLMEYKGKVRAVNSLGELQKITQRQRENIMKLQETKKWTKITL